MKKIAMGVFASAILFYASQAWAFWPVDTEKAGVLRSNKVEFISGIEYLKNRQLEFTPQERNRDIVDFPIIGVRWGIGGKSEFQCKFEGVYLDEESRESEYGSGDLKIWHKINFMDENGKFPSTGFRWGVKLPNASDEDRLGTDETDFFASMLFSKKACHVMAHLNLGLAILGEPDQASRQEDLFTYNAAVEYPVKQAAIWAEVSGYAGSKENNNFSVARIGVNWGKTPLTYSAALGVGLTEESEDWGIRGGLRYAFGP
ncbi:MAG: hypothetical protein HY350_04040, partial [Candidatus Omnitrophica bacterium]|nr:hypothetical protein [Candidatus Omnitrophota bacterium]